MCFFSDYLEYVGASEAPLIYHRWSAVGIVAAQIGRQLWIPFGHSQIYPNMYIQLMGTPGTRKSTSINIGKKVLQAAGYNRFAADRVSKERFLMEMKPYSEDELDGDLTLLSMDNISETFVVAEEFGDFIGPGNMEFATMLTKLWDNPNEYKHPKIHGKSISVAKPTVNILSGNTPQGLSLTVPPEALGNGFMSRMIFVYARETGFKITFPKPPSQEAKEKIITRLKYIREEMEGEVSYHPDSMHLLDRMYREFIGVDDPRFSGYTTRRFTHLLKLCLVLAAMEGRNVILAEDCLRANTLLHHTETKMPSALGEFGRSKYSDATNIVCDVLSRTDVPLSFNDIWKLVRKDLTKMSDLGEIMKNLMAAKQVQVLTIKGKQGYMPFRVAHKEWPQELLLENFLTDQEMVIL